MRWKTTIAAAAVASLAVPALAQAHVTVQPGEAPAGDFTRMNVRVPNERDDKGTVKVTVRMPPGFIFASYEAYPGWDVSVKKRKLAKPITSHGEKITEEVDRITWTGDGEQGIVKPGEFKDFGLSVGVPDKPNTTLTFPAIQTYEGGEVVRWIGPPDADLPASQVKLTAAEGGHGGGSGAAKRQTAAAETAGDESEGAPTWLAILALALGALGLAAGTGALLATRRRTA